MTIHDPNCQDCSILVMCPKCSRQILVTEAYKSTRIKNMTIHQKTRDDMMQILGMLKSIGFPLGDTDNTGFNTAYYDLVDNIAERYEAVLKELFPDYEG